MRKILLWAARNPWLRARVPRWRFVRRAVRRFMPGETLEAALAAADAEQARGLGVVFTLLGENLSSIGEAEAVAAHYREAIGRIAGRGLRGEISVKPTQLGLDIDPAVTARLLDDLCRVAAEVGQWVWIDMEASDYVEPTLRLYEAARRGHENVGLCLQAYLLRTPSDVARLLPLRPSVRLVKGAYDEPRTIAERRGGDVDAAYLATAVELLRGAAAGSVARAVLGTHDVRLIRQAARFAEAVGLPRNRIEVQMLYGIRGAELERLAGEGYDARSLVAYGSFWYPWYMRRLAERPANLVFALRQLLP